MIHVITLAFWISKIYRSYDNSPVC